MTPNLKNIPGTHRIFRILHRILIVVGGLVSLVILFCLEENIRGKHVWIKYKHQLEAKGEKLDFKDFIPPPIPDENNFAMTPLLAGIYVHNSNSRGGQASGYDSNAVARAIFIPHDRLVAGSVFSPSGKTTDLIAAAIALSGKTNTGLTMTRREAAEEVLRQLQPYQPQFDELVNASHRKFGRFDINYTCENPWATPLPHLAAFNGLTMIFQMRASAELAVNQTDNALRDVKMVFYLAGVANEPFLTSHLVRLTIFNNGLGAVWEGLAAHQWPDAHLLELQHQLRRFDFLVSYGDAIREERAMDVAGIEFLRTTVSLDVDTGKPERGAHLFPDGWYYLNALNGARIMQDMLLPGIDAKAHRVWRDKIPTDAVYHKEVLRGVFVYRLLTGMLLPGLNHVALKFAVAQSRLDQAIIACGLERYRLKNGQYPDALEALKPQFIDSIPHDIINGQPLIYRRKDNGNFLLYSVGWNEKDDGGKMAVIGPQKSQHVDIEQGDWVWPEYPAN